MSTMPLPSSRSCICSMLTAMPWGTSRSRSRSIFSRMISAAMTRSGWSVRASSGKKCGDSWARFESSAMTSSTPSPFTADVGTIASKSCSCMSSAMRTASCSFSATVSILLMTSTQGICSRLIFFKSSASAGRRTSSSSFSGSTTRRAASTPSMPSMTAFTIFSPSLFFGRW